MLFACFVSYGQTVTIGTQVWTSKNLDVATYRNGDVIPQVQDQDAWANLTTGAWCYYNNDPAYGDTYGKLYNWYAVTDPRGLAPQGWHIPNDVDWVILATALGYPEPDLSGSKYFFPGPRGLTRSGNGSFDSDSRNSNWWSATDKKPILPEYYYWRNGFYVRLLMD